jgi:hypothetical protein
VSIGTEILAGVFGLVGVGVGAYATLKAQDPARRAEQESRARVAARMVEDEMRSNAGRLKGCLVSDAWWAGEGPSATMWKEYAPDLAEQLTSFEWGQVRFAMSLTEDLNSRRSAAQAKADAAVAEALGRPLGVPTLATFDESERRDFAFAVNGIEAAVEILEPYVAKSAPRERYFWARQRRRLPGMLRGRPAGGAPGQDA